MPCELILCLTRLKRIWPNTMTTTDYSTHYCCYFRKTRAMLLYIYIFVWFTSFYTPFFFTRSRSFWHAIIISIFRKQIMFNIRLFCTYVQNIYDWRKHRFLSNFCTRSIYFRLCRFFATTKPVLKPEISGEKSEKSLNIHVKNPF